ncbi:MAG: bacillithiol biosynthesis deacetylase BshB2 [Bacillus sp. (in: firmicutes)]
MKQESHVLVVFPHPDDEAFGVSGTIAHYTSHSTPLTYMCLTLGEMGRNLGNPPFATRESLPSIRRKELKAAADIMGIKDLRMMGLRDKTIEFEDEELLVNMISSAVNELNTSLVITFYPGYSVHPDHDATGKAVVNALSRMNEADRPRLITVAFAHNTLADLGEPDVIHDVTDYQQTKIAAIKAHASQTQHMTEGFEQQTLQDAPEILKRMQQEKFWTYTFD